MCSLFFQKPSRLFIPFVLFVGLSLPASATSVVDDWTSAVLQAVRDTHMGPPMVARATAMMYTSMYDSWAAYDASADATMLGNSLRRPESERTPQNKEKAVCYAAYRTLADLFRQPAQVQSFRSVMGIYGCDCDNLTTDLSSAAGIGNVCAAELLRLRHSDGSNQLGDLNPGAYSDYTKYTPVNTPDSLNDPSRWQPLALPAESSGTVVQKFLVPQWGQVMPFALASPSEFRPAPPAAYPSRLFKVQARQLLQMSANLTERQKAMVQYWADGPKSETPPGHWLLLAQFVSQRDQHTLDDDVKMFFVLSNALCDASIAAWDAKRAYDSVRPISAIRFLYAGKKVRAWGGAGQGTQLIKGEEWSPYFPPTSITPPFPEHVSGHSTFSAAAAEVLWRFTGSDEFGASAVIAAGSCSAEPGSAPAKDITLQWKTFSDAADEAGKSRRYGGIHFKNADLEGRILGRNVGAKTWEKAQTYINGTAF